MARIAKRGAARRQDFETLTREQRDVLLSGRPMFTGDRPFNDIDDLATAWHLHREHLLPEHIADHPGTRPFAWWAIEHGQERPVIDAFLPQKQIDQRRAETFGFLDTSCYSGGWFQEPEFTYLDRHGLLSDQERQAAGGGIEGQYARGLEWFRTWRESHGK